MFRRFAMPRDCLRPSDGLAGQDSQEGVIMKKFLLFGAVCLLALIGQAPAPSQTPGKKVEKLMTAKLKHSQTLLEGIAIGDFKKITASAEELIQLTTTAEWLMHKTPRYDLPRSEER